MFACDWNALSSIGSVIQAIVAVVLLAIAIWKGKTAYQQWKNERAVQRSEFLESLMDRFGKDDVQTLVSFADDPIAAQKWLDDVLNDKRKEVEARSSFQYFSYICYLKDNNLVTENEFVLFEDLLKRILSNEYVQEYFRITSQHLGQDAMSPFRNLLDYAARNRIYIYGVKSISDSGECECTTQITEEQAAHTPKTNDTSAPLTEQELSVYPIVVIRINRLYRPDMTPKELYDATRGWWRVNLDMVNRAKYVLSVAEGLVKEMYAINGWQRYGTTEQTAVSGADGRYQFDGYVVTDDSIRRLYVGRSIQGIFKQGDAYPVRYFGIKA